MLATAVPQTWWAFGFLSAGHFRCLACWARAVRRVPSAPTEPWWVQSLQNSHAVFLHPHVGRGVQSWVSPPRREISCTVFREPLWGGTSWRAQDSSACSWRGCRCHYLILLPLKIICSVILKPWWPGFRGRVWTSLNAGTTEQQGACFSLPYWVKLEQNAHIKCRVFFSSNILFWALSSSASEDSF